MEQIRRRFANDIAARLAGAAESDAKSEMIEELADNLARRYEDMTAAGVSPEDAYSRAMEQLGDVDELTAYLDSQEPERTEDADGGFRADMDGLRRTVSAGRIAVEETQKAVRSALEKLPRIIREQSGTKSYVNFSAGGDAGRQDGSFHQTSIPAEGVLRLDVETVNGDVDIFVADSADAPVRVEGGEKLDIFVAEDGTLTVRERHTASNQFLFFRGMSGAGVSLTVPARPWESIRVSTASGDVDAGGGLQVGELTMQSASGDLSCRVRSCQRAQLRSASGDVHLEGSAASVQAETASGDVLLEGTMGEAAVTTASGDVELAGSVGAARARSMSGDVCVKSAALPARLVLSSKSGDVEARVPDSGPFSVRLKSVTGDVHCGFPGQGTADAPEGAERPQYTLISISGDVSLRRYK